MAQEPQITEDEARELITRLLGTGAEVKLHRFEFGWLVREVLTEEERARGMHIGQGSYIIDQTGVVTAHSSLPIPIVVAEYSEAKREGRRTGYQVWPKPATPQQ
jgi:hypothetical protein